ncbi:Taurine catabolism dioxygenase TauD, TfdA family [compost metagenome]
MNTSKVEQAERIFTVRVDVLGPDVQCHELYPGRPPLFIEPKGSTLLDRASFQQWSDAVRPVLDNLITQYGGIVLRGFAVKQTADFSSFIAAYPEFQGGYAGGRAPRAAISARVMEATRLAAEIKLGLHSEMAYRRDYPKRIAFFSCQTAAVGGETVIGDVRNLVDNMAPELVAKIERMGTRTAMNFAPKSTADCASYEHMDQRGWNLSFETESCAQVEAICAQRGLEPIWNEDGGLTVLTSLDAFVVHPHTRKKLYRSIVHGRQVVDPAFEFLKSQKYPSGTTLGNGECLEPAEIDQIYKLLDQVTYSWPWRNGDVMILDNLQVWHGRNPYKGARDVQVALLD